MISCLIYGTGKTAERYYYLLNHNYIRIIAYIDGDKNKYGKCLNGCLIDNPENIKKYMFNYILILSDFYQEIHEQLVSNYNIPNHLIIDLPSIIESRSRTILLNQYLRYQDGYHYGIEVGGANAPAVLWDKQICIKQVDICDHRIKSDAYTELKVPLVPIDIIDNGEELNCIENKSLDFIIANHFIEHCRNPIGTLRNFLKKLKINGLVFMAIPDKRYTFDKKRGLTSFQHLVEDDKNPSIERDLFHCFDKNSKLFTKDEWTKVKKLLSSTELHYHVWDANMWIQFITSTQAYLNHIFSIECVGNFDNQIGYSEILCILKKQI